MKCFFWRDLGRGYRTLSHTVAVRLHWGSVPRRTQDNFFMRTNTTTKIQQNTQACPSKLRQMYKTDERFASHSKICPKEKSEPSTQPFCATASKEALQWSSERDSNCPATLDSFIHCVQDQSSHYPSCRFTSLACLLPHLYSSPPFGGVYLLPDQELHKSAWQVSKKATIIWQAHQLHNCWKPGTQKGIFWTARLVRCLLLKARISLPYTRSLPWQWS